MTPDVLICTDLDRTLIPNGAHLESPEARRRFDAVVARPEVHLAYVTGRHLQMVEHVIEEFALPRPDFIIASVGTAIYWRRGAGWDLSDAWRRRLRVQWSEQTRAALLDLMAAEEGIEPQAPDAQSEFKLSYITADTLRGTQLEDLRRRVAAVSENVRVVASRDDYTGTGLLDLLPEAAGKLGAIRFLRGRLGVAAERVLFAGDSGNDIDALTGDLPAVLVANASEEVRRAAVEAAARRGGRELLYLARGDFLGMNGNYSAGILEGLAHFLPETRAWMKWE